MIAKRVLGLLFILLCCSTLSFAQTSLGQFLAAEQGKGTLLIRTNNGQITAAITEHRALKVRYDAGSPTPETISISVVDKVDSEVVWEVTQTEEYLTASSGDWQLAFAMEGLAGAFLYKGDTLLAETASATFEEGTSAKLSFGAAINEQFFGTGMRALPQNLRNQELEIYNQAHYGYSNGTANLNIAIPWVASSEGYGIYFDSEMPSRLDLAKSEQNTVQYILEASSEPTFYLVPGDYETLATSYADLTGYQPLPPRWALGYIQSRYGYETEEHARNVVDSMKMAGFPMDALVLDLYWFGDKEMMGTLDWDRERFPTAEKMMADFRDQGIKTILIMEPYFTRQSTNFEFLENQGWMAKNYAGHSYLIEDFWTGGGGAGLLDLYNEDTYDWFWSFYDERIKEGAAAWWSDLGEPETHPDSMLHVVGPARQAHNGFSLRWAKLLYERYQQNYPNERLMNLIRSGYGGMQRFASFPWSGDIQRSWSGYQAQVPLMLGSGLSGVAYMSSDLGGFTGDVKDEELYARWVQFGAFTPVMRLHSVGVNPEPIYFSPEIEANVLKYAKLRYRFLPYNYTLSWENTTMGWPLARPLWFHDTSILGRYSREDEYLWGKNILVAPVMEQASKSREVYLPQGDWVNYWTEEVYTGDQTISVSAPLDQIPLFVRGGSIIPLSPETQNSTEDYTTIELELHYYPSNNEEEAYGRLYHDNGTNPQTLAKGEYEMLEWTAQNGEIGFSRSHAHAGALGKRNFRVVFHNLDQKPTKVRWGKDKLRAASDRSSLADGKYFFDESSNTLTVDVTWDHETRFLKVE